MAVEKEKSLEEAGAPAVKSPKPQKLVPVVAFLFLLVLVFIICLVSFLQRRGAADLFRQYVVDPIPESVTHIKVDQPKTVGGYGYVFRFEINRTDMDRIVKSQPFGEAQISGFLGGGGLSFESKDSFRPVGTMFHVYQSKKRMPSWYTLESWDNPETYILMQEVKDPNTSDIQVLIYNAILGQAFFIVFDYGGNAIWG